VVDVLFLRERGTDLVELLETAKQIFVGLQDPPGVGGRIGLRQRPPYLMQTARTCGMSVIP
jgi:hypothetical protein